MDSSTKFNGLKIIHDAENLPECKNSKELAMVIRELVVNNLYPPHVIEEIIDDKEQTFYKLLIDIMHRYVRKYPNSEIEDFLLPNSRLDIIETICSE